MSISQKTNHNLCQILFIPGGAIREIQLLSADTTWMAVDAQQLQNRVANDYISIRDCDEEKAPQAVMFSEQLPVLIPCFLKVLLETYSNPVQ